MRMIEISEVTEWRQLKNTVVRGNCLDVLSKIPDNTVDMCITSPPYWGLRDYGHDEQIGLEESPEEFVDRLRKVFSDVRRTLAPHGSLWLNLGDSYYNYRPGKGSALSKQSFSKTDQDLPKNCPRRGTKIETLKEKDLVGIPWRVAFALQADGWYLRSDIIWHKPNPMPESVLDRPTKSHEYIFLFTKSPKYFYDSDAILEPVFPDGRKDTISKGSAKYAMGEGGNQTFHAKAHERWPNPAGKNKRSVWTITTKSFEGAHFAVFPPEIPETCIKAGCPEEVCPKCGDPVERIFGKKNEDSPREFLGLKKCECGVPFSRGLVLDPFGGSFTTAHMARYLSRDFISCDLSPEYCQIGEDRLRQNVLF